MSNASTSPLHRFTMRDLILSLFTILAFSPLLASSDGSILNDDVLGLIVFKADLHDPLSHLASWNEDDDLPCLWDGITCDPRTNRVTALSLAGFYLSGKIGRGLLRLQFLHSLTLSSNNFSGPLIPDLFLLKGLRFVDLSNNRLSGPIPAAFFTQCSSLRALSLASNELSGEIPSSISTCSMLASLNLSLNHLSGNIPNTFWALTGLRSLDLSGNSLVGELSGDIGGMYNLRAISLRGNQLSGGLPDAMGRCLLLKFVDLSCNSLSGGLPGSMRRLSMCSYMSLSTNSFSGELPSWVGEMMSLQVLDLSGNGFSGWVPESLGNLKLLRQLNLSGNSLTGSMPESMADCRSLVDVDFSRNSLTGNLPSWITQLGLQTILISGNDLRGSIKTPTGSGSLLRVLDLSGNAFSGAIPVDIGEASSLLFLNLSQNSLSGWIPVSLGELKALEVLDLSQNQLNGSIPEEINGAVSLKELNLGMNYLTGGIPTQLANCSSLTSLILSQNELTGPIPATMANLTSLQTVDLSLNRLTGTLPKQLANLPHLLSFNISHNLLSGDLPSGSFFNTIDPSSVSGNPSLCGAAVNRSCPAVLPKPIVLNPNSSSAASPFAPALPTGTLRHRKIILSISVLITIGAATIIALGVITITILNIRVRSATASRSAAALALPDDYCSHSPTSDANSGKLIMFSGEDPDFHAGDHPILSKDNELGRGGFGTVYKTVLGNGRPMAIKKLTVSSLVKSQDDFERVVKKLRKAARHPNLVELKGYYWTPSLQLLIYDFVPCGSLYRHLHETSPEDALSWRERLDIILSISKSLAHLHCHDIIHYNLKSSNVLIDGGGEAKIGDYGLAKLLPMLDRYILSSKIQSALGYMAPEFACQGVKITEKCDVYAFGVLVLEILTGRRPVEYMEDDVEVMCEVVRAALERGRVEDCVDERLGGMFSIEEAVPVIKLGLICTAQLPSSRPEMREVVNMLEVIRSPQDSQEEELG